MANQTPKSNQSKNYQVRKKPDNYSNVTVKRQSGLSLAKMRSPQRVASLFGIILLLSAAGFVTGGMWLSFKLFFDPDGIAFINNFLPQWAQIPLVNPAYQPQTLTQITASLSKLGQVPGELLPLEVDSNTLQPKSILLPVRSRSVRVAQSHRQRCESDCNQIVELRVYRLTTSGQSGEIYYQLITQLPVTAMEVANHNFDADHLLPLTAISRFEGSTPKAGIWFYLWGEQTQGTSAIAYGQVIHYNPSRSHLSLILPWTSSTGLPQWQQVINGGFPELVVDQTIDLEPQLQVYQILPADSLLDPFQLLPISLEVPAINNPDYQNALALARNGLWTPARMWLQFIKQQRQKQRQPWSTQAQAQMDFIRLHAQACQAQANKTWASPSQQVLAYLIDGRWAQALHVFQASVVNTQEVTTLLATDTGRLWNRVEVALRINPQRKEVKAWGALIKAAQQGRKSATTWLIQQPETSPATVADIQKLLRRLDGDFSTGTANHPSRILGTLEPVNSIDPTEWLQPNDIPLELTNQHWYQVQLTRYHDGKRWQQTPFKLQLPKDPGKYLWQQLGLNLDSEIEIISWLPDGQQQTILATAKAVQFHNGIRLLAVASEAIKPQTPLVITKATLQWVQPQAIALAELTQQQQPVELAAILPKLWQELHKTSPRRDKIPSVESMLQQLGQLPLQLVDFTGDDLSEVVVMIAGENKTRTRTVVLSANGSVLYSEFSHPQYIVRAIAQLESDRPPGLLIQSGKKYVFKHWSNQHQQFN